MARLELWGNQTTMNLENILYHNIMSNQYFKELGRLTTWMDVVDEIYSEVDSIAPWASAQTKVPSTAFCLLYKLFTLKPNPKQVAGMLKHRDSPMIRAIGFLYLRYCTQPKNLYQWFEPYLDDPEEFSIRPNMKPITMGKFVRDLLTSHKFMDTQLPRIPVPVQREIDNNLKEYDAQYAEQNGEEEQPRKDNSRDRDRGRDRRDRDRRRSRSRDRGRDRRSRSRDRGRDRKRSYSRDRSRSRSRDRRRRSYSRDRRRSYSRDRDRRRSDSRDRRRSRSRSRDRRRSRSRDRYRSRSRSRDRKRKSRSVSRSPDSKKNKAEESTTTNPPPKSNLEQIINMYVKPDLSKSSQTTQSVNTQEAETIRLGFRNEAKSVTTACWAQAEHLKIDGVVSLEMKAFHKQGT